MRLSSCALAIVMTLLAPSLVTLLSSPARADTYAIYRIGNGNTESVYGLTDSGIAVIKDNRCGDPGSFCFATYVNGIQTGTSTTAPALSYDNGAACAPNLPGGYMSSGPSTCNGEFGAFAARLTGGSSEVFAGPLTSPSFVETRNISADLFVNAVGDFTFSDFTTDESNFMAIDLSKAPEPSTLALLSTGALTLVGAIRRKLRSA